MFETFFSNIYKNTHNVHISVCSEQRRSAPPSKVCYARIFSFVNGELDNYANARKSFTTATTTEMAEKHTNPNFFGAWSFENLCKGLTLAKCSAVKASVDLDAPFFPQMLEV